MKEYIDPETQKKIDAVNQMVELLTTRYNASCQQIKNNKYFVITYDGGDGGDIYSNGDYEYDYHSKVNFLKQSQEEIIKILDEYFEI